MTIGEVQLPTLPAAFSGYEGETIFLLWLPIQLGMGIKCVASHFCMNLPDDAPPCAVRLTGERLKDRHCRWAGRMVYVGVTVNCIVCKR